MSKKRNKNSKTIDRQVREAIKATRIAESLKQRALVLADCFDDEWFIYNHRPTVHEELSKLVADACSLKCQNRRLGIVQRYRAQGKHWARKLGYVRESKHGESHYTCVFCEESIATFGHGQGVGYLAAPFVQKLKRHIHLCVVQHLLPERFGVFPWSSETTEA